MRKPDKKFALGLARYMFHVVGPKMLSTYRAGRHQITYKNDGSPVTNADMEAEKSLFRFLEEIGFPIISEESTGLALYNNAYWLIDPLDGTKDFIERTGEFSVMVAFILEHEPVFGLVYIPTEKVAYFAIEGKGTYEIGPELVAKRITCTGFRSLSSLRAVISRHHTVPGDSRLLQSLGVKHTVTCGSVGVKIARILQGKADIYVNTSSMTHTWDSAAPQILMSEAGGFLTDRRGDTLKYNNPYARNERGLLAARLTARAAILKKLYST